MNCKKFELVGAAKSIYIPPQNIGGYRESYIRRIRALRDFGNVKKGDIGGWVECEDNLSHKGNCWIYGDAIVCCKSFVSENAKIENAALVLDEARVYGEAHVCDNPIISGRAMVYGNASVMGRAYLLGDCRVLGHSRVGSSLFRDTVEIICDNVQIGGKACLFNGEVVCEDAKVGFCEYSDFARMFETQRVGSDDPKISGLTWTSSNRKWNFLFGKHKSRPELFKDRRCMSCWCESVDELEKSLLRKHPALIEEMKKRESFALKVLASCETQDDKQDEACNLDNKETAPSNHYKQLELPL